jgi:hypothetical protein
MSQVQARPAWGRLAATLTMERETGFEPATPSLEGWRSTAELFPRPGVTRRPKTRGRPLDSALVPFTARPHVGSTMVARGGFEPPKAFASRFTVCPLWPLGYLAIRTVDSSGTRSAGRRPALVATVIRGPPGLLTVELAKGIEPPACCLQGSRSTPELRQQATKLHPMYHSPTCQPYSCPILAGGVQGRSRPPPAAAAVPRTGGPPLPRRR